MNWYARTSLVLAQYAAPGRPGGYGDVQRRDFGRGREGYQEFRDQQYFSIGQNEDTHSESYCWVFYPDEGLRVAETAGGTHGTHFGHNKIRMKNGTKGWYDPVQKMISVVLPRESRQWKKLTPKDIPYDVYEAVVNRFGRDNRIEVF